MSLKKVDEVKKDKGFKKWDLVIYGAVLLTVAALLIAVFLTRDNSPLKGVRFYLDNVPVYEYSFTEEEENYLGVILVESAVTVEKTDAVLTVTVKGESGFNVAEIDLAAKSVKVTQADCGKRDCIYTPSITDNSGIIYCSPHRFKIVPYDFDPDDGNIIL